jgi:flagellar basal-body rod modification protein FlgD
MGTFMHLLTTELANQDPLNPTDDTAFYSQMAQMGTLQGMDNLQNSSTIQQAQSLMGATVTAVNPLTATGTGQAALVTGVVTQLSIKNGVYSLGVQEADGGIVDVPMTSIQTINGTTTTSLASMIGKVVSGTASLNTNGVTSTQPVMGTVVGVSSDSGQPMLQVQGSDGKIYSVSAGSVTNVGQ